MSDDEKKQEIPSSGEGNGAYQAASLDGGARGSPDRFDSWSRMDRDAYSRLSGTWTFTGTPHSFALIVHRLSERLSGPVRRFEYFPVQNWVEVKDAPSITRVVVLLPGLNIYGQPEIGSNGRLQVHMGHVTAVLLPNNTTRLTITVHGNGWSKVEHWWNILHKELEQNAEAAALFGQRPAPRSWLDVSERDRAIVQMLREGYTDAEIGQKYSVTPKTISNRLSELRAEFPDHVPERERGGKRQKQ